jgi:looped-hinge helix DNA binding domain, AbrB family
MKTKISSKGQVVIPKSYRQKLGWETGMELVIEEEAGQVTLKPKPAPQKKRPLSEFAGILHTPGRKASTVEEMDKAVADSFKDWDV